MLTDAIRSEAYRFSKNRTAVLWSTMFVPVLMLVITCVGQYFLKQKMGELKGANLPPELLQMGPLNLGHELVDLAGDLANPILLLFILIGAATIYAGDYRWETWRLISARNTRPNLILGKVGVVKLLSLIALVILLAFGFVGELIKGAIFERPYAFTFGGKEAGQFGLLFLVAYVRTVQVTLLGLLAATFTRSLLATLFVPLAVSIGQFFLMQAMPLMGWGPGDWYAQFLMPGLSADTLISVIKDRPDAVTGGDIWIAAASLVVWCVVPLIASIAWFQRQDLSKE
ncbi:MAG: ABC transporter permease subunit [Brevundimonas sp.]|uniref:ABC transporter permease subunit n=1 Tax=Brevundimonas sp. TaxID=1871086 RepID=UPI00403456AF